MYEPQHVDKKPVIPSKPSSTEEMRNYASSECGSKVISSNKEAQKQQAVLNENRDEYIMQPCSARYERKVPRLILSMSQLTKLSTYH